MRKTMRYGAVLIGTVTIILTLGARRVEAQGPAGAGAADVVKDSSHSYNPMRWVKKDSKNSVEMPGARSDAEKKLTPILQGEGVLRPNETATEACMNFADLEGCVAALHATHDLGLNYKCVEASVTGVHTSANLSGCKDVDRDKPQSLMKVIRVLKPEANAKQAAKSAEQEAKSDLEKIGA